MSPGWSVNHVGCRLPGAIPTWPQHRRFDSLTASKLKSTSELAPHRTARFSQPGNWRGDDKEMLGNAEELLKKP